LNFNAVLASSLVGVKERIVFDKSLGLIVTKNEAIILSKMLIYLVDSEGRATHWNIYTIGYH
jgi:hypothetical protein